MYITHSYRSLTLLRLILLLHVQSVWWSKMAVGRPLVASSAVVQLVTAMILGRLEQLSERAREREREREVFVYPIEHCAAVLMEQHLLVPSASILISRFSIHCLINILFCEAPFPYLSLSLSLSLSLPPLYSVAPMFVSIPRQSRTLAALPRMPPCYKGESVME